MSWYNPKSWFSNKSSTQSYEDECPIISFRYDYLNKICWVKVTWGKCVPREILVKDFSELLIFLQTGNLNESIKDAILNLCKIDNEIPMAHRIFEEMEAKIENYQAQRASVNMDSPVILPSEVFKERQ